MTNTSATGGYLAPTGDVPADDDDLADIFTAIVAGVTGLPPGLVRPRWQPKPPAEPPADANWAACGVSRVTPDDNAYIVHDPAGDGSDHMQRHETIEILVSFYGPNAGGYASRLRDGLAVPQNREGMLSLNIRFVDVGQAVTLPSLENQVWRQRVDVSATFRRQVNRTYPVLSLLSGHGSIVPASATPQNWSTE